MRKLIPFLIIVFLTSCANSKKDNDIAPDNQPSHMSLSSPYPNSNSKVRIDYFASDVYGPFNIGDPDFDAKFTYRADIENQRIIERMQLCSMSGDPYSTTNHAPFDYQNHALIETTFTIPIKRYLTNDGLILKFDILASPSRKVLKSYSAKFYPLIQPGWTASDLKNNYYVTKSFGFYGDGERMNEVTEAFDFCYFGDYIENDYYNRLDLKENYFYYSSYFPITYSVINLRFDDQNNLFPNLNHDSHGNVTLPLKTVPGFDSNFTLALKNTLYDDKSTLDLSEYSKNGYVKTNNLYFPINSKNKLDDKLFYVDFVDFSKSKINVSFSLRFIAGKPIFGSSNEAKYYVVGGVK